MILKKMGTIFKPFLCLVLSLFLVSCSATDGTLNSVLQQSNSALGQAGTPAQVEVPVENKSDSSKILSCVHLNFYMNQFLLISA